MEHEELVERLTRLEREIGELQDATDSPAIENCMQEMWVQIFLAKQYAGIWEAICPEQLASGHTEHE